MVRVVGKLARVPRVGFRNSTWLEQSTGGSVTDSNHGYVDYAAGDVAHLVARVKASEWLELPVTCVDFATVTNACKSGSLQIVRDGRGIDMLRLLPDNGVCLGDFTSEQASRRSAVLWRCRMQVLQKLLATVDAQTPEDEATIDALDSAIGHAAHQCGIAWIRRNLTRHGTRNLG